jgi:hypothetical protein
MINYMPCCIKSLSVTAKLINLFNAISCTRIRHELQGLFIPGNGRISSLAYGPKIDLGIK